MYSNIYTIVSHSNAGQIRTQSKNARRSGTHRKH